MTVWVLVFTLYLKNTIYVKQISFETKDQCLFYQFSGLKYLEKYDKVNGTSECKYITKI